MAAIEHVNVLKFYKCKYQPTLLLLYINIIKGHS